MFYSKFIRVICIGLFCTFFIIPVYPYSIINDSVINRRIWDADYAGALNLINSYRKTYTSNKDKSAFLLLKASEVYLLIGKVEVSKQMIAKAEAITAPMNCNKYELKFLYTFQKGKIMAFMGKDAEALQWIHRAEHMIRPFAKVDPEDAAKVYAALGDIYQQLENLPTAIKYYELAASLAKGKSLTDSISKACYQACLAEVYWQNKETGKADKLINSCLGYLNTISVPLHPALIKTYFLAADYCLLIDRNIALTRKLLLNASLILKKNYPVDHYTYGILYYYEGESEYFENDYESAFYYCNRALDLANLYPSLYPYKLMDYYLLVRIYYWYKQDYEKTIMCCNSVLSKLEQSGRSPVHFYYLLGLSYTRLNDIARAASYFEKVIRISSTTNSISDLTYCTDAYHELGKAARSEGRISLALDYFQKALHTAQKTSLKSSSLPNIYFNIGRIYYLSNEYNKALHFIQLSIISACKTFADTSIASNPDIKDVLNTFPLIETFSLKANALYRLYEKDPEKRLDYLMNALKCQQLSVNITEKTVTGIDEENSSLSLVDLKARALNNAVCYSTLLYMKTKNPVYAEKALKYAEKSKMQVLQINTNKVHNMHEFGVPETIISKEVTLNHQIIDIENRLALLEKSGGFSGTNENLSQRLAALYDLREELDKSIEKYYPVGYDPVQYDYSNANLRDIQKILKNDQVIVEYQLLNSELITFVIAKDYFNIHYQTIDSKVLENIDLLRTVLTTNPMQTGQQENFQSFISPSRFLYRILIEPVYKEIKGRRLIIVPHNKLTEIPFEVLISKLPEDKRRTDYRSLSYLIREFPVSYAYSANLLFDQDEDRGYGSGTAVFLPDYKSYPEKANFPQFSELKGAASEASAIKKLSYGKLYEGNKAGEAAFKSQAGRFRVLHIASHTLLDENNPLLSALVMTAPDDSSEDGYLYAYELSQMKLKAQLVVLSGCNTGYGRLRKSEGLVSLARSFFYTGVRTVAYTLWPVADNAGSTLTGSFYREIRHHQTLDRALRNAKLEFLEHADPVKAHPFYWAGYVIVGKTDCVGLSKYGRLPVIFGISALVALLLYFLYRKFRV
jgi:CHAT domain-containing protein